MYFFDSVCEPAVERIAHAVEHLAAQRLPVTLPATHSDTKDLSFRSLLASGELSSTTLDRIAGNGVD
eukprot:1387772-Alexandrium_andersonii.AAC.1